MKKIFIVFLMHTIHVMSMELMNDPLDALNQKLSVDYRTPELSTQTSSQLPIIEHHINTILEQPTTAEISLNACELCTKLGYYYLFQRYDYQKSLQWFAKAEKQYERRKALVNCYCSNFTRINLGRAWAYHNVVNITERDTLINNIKNEYQLSFKNKDQNKKTPFSIDYFILKGYQRYTSFEKCSQNNGNVHRQKKLLLDAACYFQYSITLAKYFNHYKTQTTSRALQGLGTLNECMGKIYQKTQDSHAFNDAFECFSNSLIFFKKAYNLRKKILSEDHLDIAWSAHKLARSYVLIKSVDVSDLYPEALQKAHEYYQEAMTSFEKNNIKKDQPTRQALEQEYHHLTSLL